LRIAGTSAVIFDNRILDNAADAVWASGDLRPFSTGVINNLPGATFDIQADGVSFGAAGESVFNNRGTLRKSVGTGAVILNAALNNDGTVEVRSGTLRVGYPVGFTGSSTGGFTVLSGATVAFFGTHQLAASVTFSGSGRIVIDAPVTYAGNLTVSGATPALAVGAGILTVTGMFTQTGGSTILVGGTLSANGGVSLQGGTLSGSGTIVGTVTNAAAIVVGDATTIGTLSITGTYTQTSAGSLTLKVGGTVFGRFDRLSVTGSAVLAGTLQVTVMAGYTPMPGDSIRVLTADSLSGMFNAVTGPFDPQYDATGLTLRRR
jgi:hypothetical protein